MAILDNFSNELELLAYFRERERTIQLSNIMEDKEKLG
jgi:hypothetical protein